jgi:hypothetical protein
LLWHCGGELTSTSRCKTRVEADADRTQTQRNKKWPHAVVAGWIRSRTEILSITFLVPYTEVTTH